MVSPEASTLPNKVVILLWLPVVVDPNVLKCSRPTFCLLQSITSSNNKVFSISGTACMVTGRMIHMTNTQS